MYSPLFDPPLEGVDACAALVALDAGSGAGGTREQRPSHVSSSRANAWHSLSASARNLGLSLHVSPHTHRKSRSRSARSTVSYGPAVRRDARVTHTRCAPSKSANSAATSSGGGASSSSVDARDVEAALVRTRTRGLASYRTNISSLKTRRGTLRSTGSCDVLRRRSTRRVDATDRLASARSDADTADASSSSGAAGAAKSPCERRRRRRARGGEKKVRGG